MRARMRRLHHSISCAGLVAVVALEDLALRFQRAERDVNVADIERKAFCQIGRRYRAEAFHPAAHGGERVVDGIPALGGDPEFAIAALRWKTPGRLRSVPQTTSAIPESRAR